MGTNRFVGMLLSVALLCAATSAQALDIDIGLYDIYIGDIDGDGDKDVYFHDEPVFVLIASDVNVPLFAPSRKSFLLTYDAITATYSAPTRYGLVSHQIVAKGLAAGVSGTDYIISDINGDNADDVRVFISGQTDAIVHSTASISEPPPPPSSIVSPSLVGTTAAQFSVSNGGAANYDIPITMVPGVAGHQPSVTLSYNSLGGNGVAGQGWGLSATSGISRCRQTYAADGQMKAINFSKTDRFCLDGKKLVLSSGTAYGAVGAHYKTEIDSFVRVESVGGSLGHPSYFRVYTKDGSTIEYGRTSNAKLKATFNSNLVLDWKQNRHLDLVGNYIDYTYTTDKRSQGEMLIDEIAYTGNATTGLTPKSRIEFDYEGRLDPISGYTAGSKYAVTKRLHRIRVFDNSSEVRRYQLLYQATDDSYNKLSRLSSVQECVGSRCLPATKFSWQSHQTGFESSYTTFAKPDVSPWEESGMVADLNNDGKEDYLFTPYSEDSGAIKGPISLVSDGNTLTQTFRTTDSQAYMSGFGLTDYDGDGVIDFLYGAGKGSGAYEDSIVPDSVAGYGYPLYVQKNSDNGQGAFEAASHTGYAVGYAIPGAVGGTAKAKDYAVADFNGDGLGDLMRVAYYDIEVDAYGSSSKRHWHIFFRERDPNASSTANTPYRFKSGTAVNIISSAPGIQTYGMAINAKGLDFNSDGINDLAITIKKDDGSTYGQAGWMTAVGDGKGNFYERDIFLFSRKKPVMWLDANNDGLTDMLYAEYGGTGLYDWSLRLNNGTSFNSATYVFTMRDDSGSQGTFTPSQIDYNRDGYTDLAFKENSDDFDLFLWDPAKNKYVKTAFVPSDFRAPEPDADDLRGAYIDIDGDGRKDFADFQAGRIYKAKRPMQPDNTITSIRNGLGETIDLTYKVLHDKSNPVYQKENDARHKYWDLPSGSQALAKSNGVKDIAGASYVIEKVKRSAPRASESAAGSVNNSAMNSTSYFYQGAKMQTDGRGFLGFHKVTKTNEQTGVKTITTFRQDFPFIGKVRSVQVKQPNGKLLSSTTQDWRLKSNLNGYNKAPFLPYVATRVEKTNDLASGAVLKTLTGTYQYDNDGNVIKSTVTTAGGGLTHTQITENEYENPELRFLGLPSMTVTTASRSDDPYSRTHKIIFDYFDTGNIKNTLQNQIVEPDVAAVRLETEYERNGFGLPTKVIQRGQTSSGDPMERYERKVYDSRGRVDETYNAKEQRLSRVLTRNSLGQPTTVEGLNNRITYKVYDSLGREISVRDNTGAEVTTRYATCSSSCPSGAAYRKEELPNTGGGQTTYFDKNNRVIRVSKVGFTGTSIHVDIEYDSKSREKRKSEPYYTGDVRYWTHNTYDLIHRLKTVDRPGGNPIDVSYAYNGLVTTFTNTLGQQKIETKNVLGQLVRVEDELASVATYDYDADGNLTRVMALGNVTDPHSIETHLGYDKLGRKTSMDDPDKGSWSYAYNSFGELESQTDANGQTSTISYDTLGRMVERVDQKADTSIEGLTMWTYDTATNGVGQLADVQNIFSGYAQYYTYDSVGRMDTTETDVTVAGTAKRYRQEVKYDAFGRLEEKLDPVLATESSLRGTRHVYNSHGYLERIVNRQDASQVYYDVQDQDARGNVTEMLLGNGLTTQRRFDPATGYLEFVEADLASVFKIQDLRYAHDAIGNMTSRKEYSGSKHLEETFTYDQLNRLTGATAIDSSSGAPGTPVVQDFAYDSLGNITSKTGVGTYTYGQNAGPHAVTATTLDGVTTNHYYDANGNLTGDSEGRTLTYTTFDKVSSVSYQSHTTTFSYGPDRSRYKRIDTDADGTTTTLYVGNVEIIEKPNGDKEHKRYIEGQIVETHTETAAGEVSTKVNYIYTDHLGSVDVITDGDGNIVQEMSFDAFGQRRNAVNWDKLTPVELISFDHDITTRGYTGHEMLDEVGLIHMNGRVYNPSLARFVSADPLVQAPNNIQSLNRYSYVWNNPLAFTDPSGFCRVGLGKPKSDCADDGENSDEREAKQNKEEAAKQSRSTDDDSKIAERGSGSTQERNANGNTESRESTVWRVVSKDGKISFTNVTEGAAVDSKGQAAEGEVAAYELPGKDGLGGGTAEQTNLKKAEVEFRRMYEAGLLPENYNFIENWEGGLDNKAFSFKYIDARVPGRVAEMDIYGYTGATVYKGGAATFAEALDTVAHEIYHLEPFNQKLWKSGNPSKRRIAQGQAIRYGAQVVRRWEENQ